MTHAHDDIMVGTLCLPFIGNGFNARVPLVKYFPQQTHFSHHHITTRTGTKMKTTDATYSQL